MVQTATAVPSAQPTDSPDFQRNRWRLADRSAVMSAARSRNRVRLTLLSSTVCCSAS